MSTAEGVRIVFIQNNFSVARGEEFVVISNASNKKFDLNGWRLVYWDLSSRKELYTHHFLKLHAGAFFAPGELLFVISGRGTNRFQPDATEPRCPAAHWDVYTDYPLEVLNIPAAAVQLLDESEAAIDSATIHRRRGDEADAEIEQCFAPPDDPIGFVG